MDKNKLLCTIPKVDEILKQQEIQVLLKSFPKSIVLDSVRDAVDSVRKNILESPDEELKDCSIDIDDIIKSSLEIVRYKSVPSLKKVINAAGVIIHTNLGRSILCSEAVEAAAEAAKNYTNLEYDLDKGERGSRYSHIEDIIVKITGAESAMAVNNNAGAVMLVLSALCRGKEAIVSRGELVEIGGSFRIPEVMEMSGAQLHEVGTTNKTHYFDYEKAVGENTGVILKVHTSNYRILGFTESVSRKELVELGAKTGIPVVEDLGSGNFIDLTRYGLDYEPTVQDAVRSGIDVVTFSGDKMLGGPQAGIIAGKKKFIDMIKKNPLVRALRIDKMTLAALEATLRQYLDENMAVKNIPTLRMITSPENILKKRAQKLLQMLKSGLSNSAEVKVEKDYSEVGGGSMPLENLPTFVVSIKHKSISSSDVENRLRRWSTPIIARVVRDRVLIDVRTIEDRDLEIIKDAVINILGEVNI